MSRLDTEFRRLFAANDQGALHAPEAPCRALVLGLRAPADWTALAAAWQALRVVRCKGVDLARRRAWRWQVVALLPGVIAPLVALASREFGPAGAPALAALDRKSTRLNSSH